jgi:uncharacterized protein YggE
MKKLIPVLILTILLTPIPVIAGEIAAKGSAETEVIPDKLILRMSVIGEDKSPKGARERAQGIVDLLEKEFAGLDKEETTVKTEGIMLDPQYGRSWGKDKVKSYRMHAQYEVSGTDIEPMIQMMQRLMEVKYDKYASLSIYGLQWALTPEKKKQTKESLIAEAVMNARRKIDAALDSLELKAGSILEIELEDALAGRPRQMVMREMDVAFASMESSSGPSVHRGTIQMSITATMVVGF